MTQPDTGPRAFTGSIDLLADALGGEALLSSDDFFAEKENLTKPERAVFLPDEYTDRGKWMDGWESRRKRVPGHDWCILKLGVKGEIEGFDIDTAHFLGNHPPYASIDACVAPDGATPEELRDQVEWTEVLPQVALAPGSQNLFAASRRGPWTHVRLNIFPDGGVARLRAYGSPAPDPATVATGKLDLVASSHGGRALACSDMFFGQMSNLIAPGRAQTMGEGWETRRRRDAGQDWVILQLGIPGSVEELELDTSHFKGNYPDRFDVEGIWWPGAPPTALMASNDWRELVPETKLRADSIRAFETIDGAPCTHLRLNIRPCGGVARLRAFGHARQPDASHEPLLEKINGLSEDDARTAFTRCCGARRWVERMVWARPFTSRAHLFGASDVIWWSLGDGDWLEAFTHHPKIGENKEALREKFAGTADWSGSEQSAVSSATDTTIEALAEENRAYSERFGHIFIVCATGKSADEMLGLLRARIDNEAAAELRIAAGEQSKITRLRLEKLETE